MKRGEGLKESGGAPFTRRGNETCESLVRKLPPRSSLPIFSQQSRTTVLSSSRLPYPPCTPRWNANSLLCETGEKHARHPLHDATPFRYRCRSRSARAESTNIYVTVYRLVLHLFLDSDLFLFFFLFFSVRGFRQEFTRAGHRNNGFRISSTVSIVFATENPMPEVPAKGVKEINARYTFALNPTDNFFGRCFSVGDTASAVGTRQTPFQLLWSLLVAVLESLTS